MSLALPAQYEGAFAQPNPQYQLSNPPYPSAPAGAGQFVAAPANGGTIQGRFGWGDPFTGHVTNTPVAGVTLCVVVPIVGWRASWGRVFFDPTVKGVRIRAGLPVTVVNAGPFWLRFASGAVAGQRVYASNVDGSAISGDTGGAITPTQWTVSTRCGPGGLAIVSTSAFYGA